MDSELVTERIRSSQAAAQHRIDQQALVASVTAAEKKAAMHAQQAAQLHAELKVKTHISLTAQYRELATAHLARAVFSPLPADCLVAGLPNNQN